MFTFYHVIAFLAGATTCWLFHMAADWIERYRVRRALDAINRYVREQETLEWEKEKSEE